MEKYTVIWSFDGEANRADYIECAPTLSTQGMVREAVRQNIADWSEVLEEYYDDIDELLDEGYYLYAIIEGHPRIVY